MTHQPINEPLEHPTPAQLEALALRARGYNNEEVSKMLWLAPQTAKERIARMMGRTGFRNMFEACAWYGQTYGRG